jgi:O-antigen/teichoic acid export membrane protein
MFLFSIVSTLGMDDVIVREATLRPDDLDSILGTAFTMKATGAVLANGMIVAALVAMGESARTIAVVGIIATGIIFKSFNVVEFYFQSIVKVKYAAIAQTSQVALMTAVRFALVWLEAPLIAFALAAAGDFLFFAVGLLIAHRKRRGSFLRWRFDYGEAKRMLVASLPLTLAGALTTLYMRIDQVMIREALDFEAVGAYALAARFSEAWLVVPVAAVGSLFPALLIGKEMDDETYHERLQYLYTAMVWMGLGVGAVTLFAAGPVFDFLFAGKYADAARALTIHIWAGVFGAFGVARSKWMIAENLQRYTIHYTTAGAATNVALNFALIPLMGVDGAAVATVVGVFVAAYVSSAAVKPLRPSAAMFLRALVPLFLIKKPKRWNPLSKD